MSLNPEIEYLYSLQRFGVKLGLENTSRFLQRLGNPESKLKIFHIAGSNGKGSTSSYIASILLEAGYSVGLYTSPHFVTFHERIQIDGNYIEDEYIRTFVRRHKEFITEYKLTFFEVTTVMALSYFAENKVDYVVLETGLGGRLDATNVVHSMASVITSISLEHTDILGSTITQIAGEKAAIIKQDSKVFIGKLPADAVNVIERTCDEKCAECFELEDYIIERDDYIELYTEELDIDKLNTPLLGEYQRRNAALAILAVYETLAIVDPDIYENGIRNVITNTRIQGRFEIIRKNPAIIMDSAHNLEGIESFVKEFRKYGKNYSKKTLLFTALKDKAAGKMLELVQNDFDEIILTTLELDRALTQDEAEEIIKNTSKSVTFKTHPSNIVSEFLNNANPTECLVITGSMYLLGEVKQDVEKFL